MALAVVFVILGTLFTLFPEFLSHSVIGVAERGTVHHIWHGMILLGGLALMIGLILPDRVFEAVGLIGCGVPTVAALAGTLTAGPLASASGITIALQLVVLSLIGSRLADMRESGVR